MIFLLVNCFRPSSYLMCNYIFFSSVNSPLHISRLWERTEIFKKQPPW